jgi:hypothetical protein
MQEILTQLCTLVRSLDLTAFGNQNGWDNLIIPVVSCYYFLFNYQLVYQKYNHFNRKSKISFKFILFFSCFLYRFILFTINYSNFRGLFFSWFSEFSNLFGYFTFFRIYLMQRIWQLMHAICNELLPFLSVWYSFNLVFCSRNLMLYSSPK